MTLKFTGFILEVEKNIPGWHFRNMFTGRENNNERGQLIKYLEQGVFFQGVMTYLFDMVDGEGIGGESYYTDGVYVWPNYYLFYLKKYKDFAISRAFYQHALEQNFLIGAIEQQELSKIDAIFTEYWCGKRRGS